MYRGGKKVYTGGMVQHDQTLPKLEKSEFNSQKPHGENRHGHTKETTNAK